jgi:transcriptional regulator with XRE-family HTH domain
MPAKELTSEQKLEAAALAARFKDYQDAERGAGRPWSQEAVASTLGMGQSALNQYLTGRIPLNGEFVLAMAELLGAHPRDVSALVWAEQEEFQRRWRAACGQSATTFSENAANIARDFDAMRPDQQRTLYALFGSVRALVSQDIPVTIGAGSATSVAPPVRPTQGRRTGS